ncbi:hypothetical protein E2C01_032219 [Portunus trituberculatus]|uniref:Uncharacterized protein n=1 Tax=Portunus trituberculatus TaxID=210409 RepID=A0A5B7EZR5_PORTR|nr:hypothetical protein [Portunus trituberculatus]
MGMDHCQLIFGVAKAATGVVLVEALRGASWGMAGPWLVGRIQQALRRRRLRKTFTPMRNPRMQDSR